ncbi:M20/M25/M40 family metallo-hydrolase [Microcella daejeonensis]|uniref:M20/M25/M40 family metallo-hydrolase n=1 Tax=Microcella daejeonensis TaxID=2994971 RepID=A0A9E8MK41_9MICO|nr:M20/M25/M40 family metallo-hydrolase [Microcella daejeonensis]WAB81003.1 M20/M25/M40 family metallo-hydrolase [Microcella daejeonensis]
MTEVSTAAAPVHGDDAALERFRELLRIPTVSSRSGGDPEPFDRFLAALPRLYPGVHAVLQRERHAGHALLYRWEGREPGPATVLMAHYDVVPADDEGWEHPPFDAVLARDETGERVLWGRGTLDDKGAAVAVLEAVERLLAEGVTPRHDVLLAFGHDEETAGTGARAIVRALEKRGERPALVLDEGGAIVQGAFPGVAEPFAVIGVAEKGVTVLHLRVDQHGGHAASPPPLSATDRLARAVLRLAERPAPVRLDPTTRRMIRTLGAHARPPLRTVFRLVDVLAPVLARVLARRGPETAAMVRTTRAVTELRAGHAANALAERAEATVNMRVAPGSSVEEAVEQVRRAIDDPQVVVSVTDPSEPSPVSPAEGEAWNAVVAAVQEVHPGLLVTPYVMMQASDARWFTTISDHVYRFAPFRMSGEERSCLHARNERIRVDAWLEGIEVYAALLRRR